MFMQMEKERREAYLFQILQIIRIIFFFSSFFWNPIQMFKSSEEYATTGHGIINTFGRCSTQ